MGLCFPLASANDCVKQRRQWVLHSFCPISDNRWFERSWEYSHTTNVSHDIRSKLSFNLEIKLDLQHNNNWLCKNWLQTQKEKGPSLNKTNARCKAHKDKFNQCIIHHSKNLWAKRSNLLTFSRVSHIRVSWNRKAIKSSSEVSIKGYRWNKIEFWSDDWMNLSSLESNPSCPVYCRKLGHADSFSCIVSKSSCSQTSRSIQKPVLLAINFSL